MRRKAPVFVFMGLSFLIGPTWWVSARLSSAGPEIIGLKSDYKYKKTREGLMPLPEPSSEQNSERLQLGRDLFETPLLSRNGTVSCSSCHQLNAEWAGTDGHVFSVGIDGYRGGVNTPTVYNAVLNFRQFWDGRARTLSEQINGPIHNPKEMGSDWPSIVKRLRADPGWKERFEKVYQSPPSADNIVDAIVAFENQLLTPHAPFDRYLEGDLSAISESQIRGFEKFQSFGCISCHQGANVGGNMYQTFGVMGDYFADRGGSLESDKGRFNVTKKPDDLHVFRVPSLRNVEKTAPYFHDGHANTLEQAVRIMGKYQLGLNLSKTDTRDLVEFLKSLTGEEPAVLQLKRQASP